MRQRAHGCRNIFGRTGTRRSDCSSLLFIIIITALLTALLTSLLIIMWFFFDYCRRGCSICTGLITQSDARPFDWSLFRPHPMRNAPLTRPRSDCNSSSSSSPSSRSPTHTPQGDRLLQEPPAAMTKRINRCGYGAVKQVSSMSPRQLLRQSAPLTVQHRSRNCNAFERRRKKHCRRRCRSPAGRRLRPLRRRRRLGERSSTRSTCRWRMPPPISDRACALVLQSVQKLLNLRHRIGLARLAQRELLRMHTQSAM